MQGSGTGEFVGGGLLLGKVAEEALLLGAGAGVGVGVEEEGKFEVKAVDMELIGADGGSPTETIQPMKVIMI